MRKLHIIPIVHSRHDLGSLDGPIQEFKSQTLSDSVLRSSRSAVEYFWQELKSGISNWHCDFKQVVLYQDALPFTGHPDGLIEHQIVRDLSAKGSPNHQLLNWLIENGATLLGTESTELLLKEYEAVRKSLADGFRDETDENGESPHTSLLVQRDRFIADRIRDTLQDGQIGLLFVGMLHRVESYLDSSILVEYPFGRPKVAQEA